MKILMINPPYVLDTNQQTIEPNKAMLPVGPLSMAAGLLERHQEVVYLDLVWGQWQEKMKQLYWPCFDLILLHCHTARNIPVCATVVKELRELGSRAPVVLGGNVCQLERGLGNEDFDKLGLEVEAVVRGYGHGPDVFEALLNHSRGDIIPTTVSAEMPVPALGLLDQATHKLYQAASNGRYPLVTVGGFGCPWQCNYCLARTSRHQPRIFENIYRDLWQATGQYGYRHLWCVDNVFLLNPQMIRVFDEIASDFDLKYSAMTRHETVLQHSQDFSGLLCLDELAMGVESASDEQLANWERGGGKRYQENIDQAFAVVRELGIKTNAFVMLDGPNETVESFWTLYEFLKRLKLSTLSWSFYNPPPRAALTGRPPSDFGFYRWPLGCSKQPPTQVVQQAMLLSGTFWNRWRALNQPFFINDGEFGVEFREATLLQNINDRSPIGDLWEVWRQTERR